MSITLLSNIYDFFSQLFSAEGFPPRWVCGQWSPFHGWLYITASLATWAAYFAIPLSILYFVRRRSQTPFKKIYLLFTAFILSCGITHLVDAIIFWIPVYRLNAVFIAGTAVISWITVFGLIRAIPEAIKFKSPAELEDIIRQKTLELAEANQKLAISERQLKALINNNPDLISRVNCEAEIEFISDVITNLTQKPASVFIGKCIDQLGYPESYTTPYIAQIKKVFDSKTTIVYEPPFLYGRYYRITIVPLLEQPGGEVRNAMTITRDITSEKKATLQQKEYLAELQALSRSLMQKNAQLESFAHIVSHNLRSPVGNFMSLFQLYDDEKNADEKAIMIENIKEVAYQLNDTVETLTQIIRIRHQGNVVTDIVSFTNVLQKLKTMLQVQISDANAQLSYNFRDADSIEYPKVYMESIMQNLLTNAIKYRHPERAPQIHFQTIQTENTIILTCSDNGLGMDLKKVGHKLFGLNRTFHRHPDARGVGLFITKNQVESLGGSIEVESTPGIGSTFRIIFKLH